MDHRGRPRQGRARSRRAVPEEGLDRVVASAHLAWPPCLSFPQARVRCVRCRPLVPVVRNRSDRSRDGTQAAEVAKPGGRLTVRIRFIAGAAVLAASMSACTGSSGSVGPEPNFSPNPKHRELVARAHLDRCPPSQQASVPGGLPDVTLPCLGGGPAVHLAGLVGKPLVVNIWGSWCGPCQAETRYLSQVYDELRAQVRFLGVDTEDDPKSALDFAPHVSPPMRYPQVVDRDKRLLIALNIPSSVPTSVFVDASG